MSEESYTPGHAQNVIDFMAVRTLETHGRFILPHLTSSSRILDVGCGPGSITLGLAGIAKEGHVDGIDFAESQVELANANASRAGTKNVAFQVSSCYALPFDDESFDCVFSNALLEHLSRPMDAIREFFRVLRPKGTIGVCSPDFDGWLLAPTSDSLIAAAKAYAALQDSNGGNLRAGKHLSSYLLQAGFEQVQMEARYECYRPLSFIGHYLANQLEKAGMDGHAACFRQWSQSEGGMFAQSWVSATGTKP